MLTEMVNDVFEEQRKRFEKSVSQITSQGFLLQKDIPPLEIQIKKTVEQSVWGEVDAQLESDSKIKSSSRLSR